MTRRTSPVPNARPVAADAAATPTRGRTSGGKALGATSAAFLGIAAILGGAAPAAAEFPEKPVTMIAPFNAGGSTDLLLRGLQAPFAEALGGDVVVQNMAGGSGTVAASHLAGVEPDGYTLGYLSITVSTIQPQIKNVPYDVDSWTPVCSVAASPTLFYVRPDADYASLDDVKAAAEAEPGRLIFGSSGPGAITHLTMVAAMNGLDIMDKVKHLPHEGSGPAMKSMAGGVIEFFGDTEVMMSSYELKPLAVFADERLPSLPDVPTAGRIGHRGAARRALPLGRAVRSRRGCRRTSPRRSPRSARRRSPPTRSPSSPGAPAPSSPTGDRPSSRPSSASSTTRTAR